MKVTSRPRKHRTAERRKRRPRPLLPKPANLPNPGPNRRQPSQKRPKPAAPVPKSPEDKKQSEKEKKLAKKKELQQRVARAPLEGRGVLAAPPAVLVRNATIWTCGPEGRIEHADLLVEGGKVRKVGTGIAAPKNALVIEGEGLHVTPGLVDCHSHSVILGDVNEGTLPSSAMVRIGD